LTTAKFDVASRITYSAFSGCTNLKSLYLLSTARVTLAGGVNTTFANTPFVDQTVTDAFIYVPSNLLSSYQSTSTGNMWSTLSSRFVAYSP
jgi:hypothetical protein